MGSYLTVQIEWLVTTTGAINPRYIYLVRLLQWHHNGCHGMSNHRQLKCLFNGMFRRTSKKASKFRVTDPLGYGSTADLWFPSQRASKPNAKNDSLSWRHHGTGGFKYLRIPLLYNAFYTWKSRQNGRHFTDDIFKCMFLNGIVWISLMISPKFLSKFRINNIPVMVQIIGAKPLCEPVMA